MVYTLSDGTQMTRRKKIVLTGAGSGALSDHQLKLTTLWEAAMQADYDDARFVKADMQTLIDAWLESKTDSTTADIWAEFPTTPADGVEEIEAYMYYGNVAAASDWNMSNTFPDLCDDFEDNDVSDWSGSTMEIESTVVKTGTYSGKATGINGPYKTGNSKTVDYSIEFDCRHTSTSDTYIAIGKDDVAASNCIFLRIDEGDQELQAFDGSYHTLMTSYLDDVWYKLIIDVHFNTNTFDIWVDGTTRGTGIGTRGAISEHNNIYPFVNGDIQYFDNIFSRKYAANPPTAAFGTEEHQRRTPIMM